MTALQRVQEALAAVRKSNASTEFLQVNEFILTDDEVAKTYSQMRVDLSCAAAHLAHVVDEKGGGL